MHFTAVTLIFIIFIVISSIFVADFIDMDNQISRKLKEIASFKQIDWIERRKMLKMEDGPEHLMWFLQISDLHISLFRDPLRVPQLREFCNNTVDIVRPSVVLASGDLTDAKMSNMLGSMQFEEEWKIYENVLKESNIDEKTVWLDIRGNHDNFNVPNLATKYDYYSKYSIQGKKHQRSYAYHLKKGDDKYTFIGVDACLEPGPKRPFNFLGLLTSNETNKIIDLAEISKELKTNHTIWFGHYPTSCILSPANIRNIIGKFEGHAYLCGHFHTLGGMVPSMYTLQKEGFLEIELGDWMKNRMYRLAAFDHGFFSFIDLYHNKWPIVLITNPKNALLNVPDKEDPNLILESTHIRLIAFSKAKITECMAKIDDEAWVDCRQMSKELFVVPWDPFIYRTGLHKIFVMVKDANGRAKTVEQDFSLDGSKLKFGFLARLILMYDINKCFKIMFTVALLLCILPLIILRVWHSLVLKGKLHRPRLRNWFCGNIIKKLWILSTINRIIYPIIGYCLYLTCGPWQITEVLDNHLAVVFVWGIFVNNAFLPGTLQYFYGFFQLILCQFPLIFVFADNVSRRYTTEITGSKPKDTFCQSSWQNLPFVLIMLVEIILAIYYWTAYGTFVFLITPLRTWSVILNMTLWYHSKYLPSTCLRSAIQLWSS